MHCINDNSVKNKNEWMNEWMNEFLNASKVWLAELYMTKALETLCWASKCRIILKHGMDDITLLM